MRSIMLLLPLLCIAATVRGDGEPIPDPASLIAEHRSAGASEGRSLLDNIASLFGGGSAASEAVVEKSGPPPPRPVRRPSGGGLPPFKKGPIYIPAGGGDYQQSAAASNQRPLAVLPPGGYGGNTKRDGGSGGFSHSGGLSPVSQPAYGITNGPADPWQISQPANMAQIKDLQVQCEKDLMRVRVIFDRPFYGMVFSKGHYSNVNCVHVPSGLGQTQATFDIALGQCGMSTGGNSEGYGAPTPQGSYIENTVIIQYDPLLQEVWDQARKIRCTWYDFYEKAVTFKPYQVDMLDPVTANFLGDNLRCWMQIQVGKGPYASEVSGIVKIGQTMTMVLGVKDDESKFDMMVRNCVAHDGQRAPIQLVDEKGCVVREKIMSQFKKLKNFDSTANVLSYAYFQAFKFPDSMNVHFQCVVQVCRNSCPEPACGNPGVVGGGSVDSYGAPQAPTIDSYGGPAAPALDSYGAPLPSSYSSGGLSSYASKRIDPRVPDSEVAGSERRVSIVKPAKGSPRSKHIPINLDLIDTDTAPGISKRLGEQATNGVEGSPRSLEFDEGEEIDSTEREAKSLTEAETVEAEKTGTENRVDKEDKEDSKTEDAVERRRREVAIDGNGNRILSLRRRKRETGESEEESPLEEADIQTERVIRVVSGSDVQFQLSKDDKEEVVFNTNAVPTEALCIDTAAFVGVTISILMLLVVAIITIIFLWLRIRAIDRKNLL